MNKILSTGFAFALAFALVFSAFVNPFTALSVAMSLLWSFCCMLVIGAFQALIQRNLHLALEERDPTAGIAASVSMIGLMLFVFMLVAIFRWVH